MTVQTWSLADTLWAVIDAIPNLNTYRNEIVDATGAPVDPPPDEDGRSHPYAVAYFGAGQAVADRMSSTPSRTPVTFQVSCVGGDDTRCLWAADQVRAALTGKAFAGGRVVELTDPGPPSRDDNIQPPRTTTHLIFRIHARG